MEQIAGKVLLRRSNPSPPPTPDKAYCASPVRANSLQQRNGTRTHGARRLPERLRCGQRRLTRHLVHRRRRTLSREDSIFCDLRRAEFHSSAMLRSGEVMAVITPNPKNPRLLRWKPSEWHRYGALPPRPTYSGTYPAGPRPRKPRRAQSCPVVEYDRKDFVQDVARALIEKEVGLEAEEPHSKPHHLHSLISGLCARRHAGYCLGALIPERNAPKSSKGGTS